MKGLVADNVTGTNGLNSEAAIVMARKQREPRKAQPSRATGGSEEISVQALRGISIHFPGDVYWLAVWIAMSDLAMSTPTARHGTTLHGLAKHFASLADSLERPLTVDMIMDRFRQHGLEGNPVIRLPPEHAAAAAAFIAGDRPLSTGNTCPQRALR